MRVRCQPARAMHGRVADWVAEIRRFATSGETVLVRRRDRRAAPSAPSSCSRSTRSSPCRSSAPKTRATRRCWSPSARCRADSACPTPALQIYAETDVFEEERRAPERRRSATKAFLSDLRDLKVGDLVVHVDHGIGVFVGLKQIGVGRATPLQEFLELRYAGEDKLFVPVERLDLVQKYTGAVAAAARSARRHDVGEGQDARQEGDARHGRGAAQALRRAQGGSRPRVQPRLALAAGVRGRVPVRADARSDSRRSPTSSATWSRRRRWIGCCAATSATARPKSRCAPRSRR